LCVFLCNHLLLIKVYAIKRESRLRSNEASGNERRRNGRGREGVNFVSHMFYLDIHSRSTCHALKVATSSSLTLAFSTSNPRHTQRHLFFLRPVTAPPTRRPLALMVMRITSLPLPPHPHFQFISTSDVGSLGIRRVMAVSFPTRFQKGLQFDYPEGKGGQGLTLLRLGMAWVICLLRGEHGCATYAAGKASPDCEVVVV
jgi:hypothetical protein